MAIRCYSCPVHGEFEANQRVTEPVLKLCPHCQLDADGVLGAGPVQELKSLISLGAPPVFVYKPHSDCSGWSGEGYSKAEHKRKADKILGRS